MYDPSHLRMETTSFRLVPEKLPELSVSETRPVDQKIKHVVQLSGRLVDQGTILIDERY